MLTTVDDISFYRKAVIVNITIVVVTSVVIAVYMFSIYNSTSSFADIDIYEGSSSLIRNLVKLSFGLNLLAQLSSLYFIIRWNKNIFLLDTYLTHRKGEEYAYLYWLIPIANIYLPLKEFYRYFKTFRAKLINSTEYMATPLPDPSMFKGLLIICLVSFGIYSLSDNIFSFIIDDIFYRPKFTYIEENIVNEIATAALGLFLIYFVIHLSKSAIEIIRIETEATL